MNDKKKIEEDDIERFRRLSKRAESSVAAAFTLKHEVSGSESELPHPTRSP